MVDNILPALAIFAAAASITPGPNNIMVMASGANFGLVRSLPHLCGISAGVFAIICLMGLGLMAVFDALPVLQTVMRAVSALYLLWLAWKIAIAVPPEAKARGREPLTFFQSATFQAVNPKIWATGFSAITLFAADRLLASVILVAIAFAVSGWPRMQFGQGWGPRCGIGCQAEGSGHSTSRWHYFSLALCIPCCFLNHLPQREHFMDTPDITDQLSSFRQTIDNIDAALIHMLAERFRCTDQVGVLKAEHHLPAVDKKREQHQYDRLTELAEHARLDPVFVEKLMQFVISEVVQRHKKIATEHSAAAQPYSDGKYL